MTLESGIAVGGAVLLGLSGLGLIVGRRRVAAHAAAARLRGYTGPGQVAALGAIMLVLALGVIAFTLSFGGRAGGELADALALLASWPIAVVFAVIAVALVAFGIRELRRGSRRLELSGTPSDEPVPRIPPPLRRGTTLTVLGITAAILCVMTVVGLVL